MIIKYEDVRKQIQRLEEKVSARTPKWKRGSGVQERQTSPLQQKRQAKQSKVTYYFASKSLKAMEARNRVESRTKPPDNLEANQGNSESKHKPRGPSTPIREIRVGHEGHPTADAMDPKAPSVAMAGCAEESGRPARKCGQEQQRTEWVLGKTGSGKKDRKLRLTKEAPQENYRPRTPAAKVRDLRHWFEAKGKDSGPTLEPGRKEEQFWPSLGSGWKESSGNGNQKKEPTGK